MTGLHTIMNITVQQCEQNHKQNNLLSLKSDNSFAKDTKV